MPTPFDIAKTYAPQEEVFFDDGREIELLHYIYNHPNLETSIRGSPTGVLAAIDEFARTQKYLMNVGEDKGRIVTSLIQEVRPRTMVELGGYIGYSSILFGAAVRDAAKDGGDGERGEGMGKARYFSLERNPEFGAVIASLVDLAELSDVVKVVVGSSDASLKRLFDNGTLTKIDLMFLDHYKPAYTTDLKLCEELGLIDVGSVLAADNVVKPGNPPYLKYVRSSVEEKRTAVAEETKQNGTNGTNGLEESFGRAAGQYDRREGRVKLNEMKGNPNLVYESQQFDSWEPSGVPDAVEITRCVSEEKA
jgi:catechol O-methyltransferase